LLSNVTGINLDVAADCHEKTTPLRLAIKRGRCDAVRYLIGKGATCNGLPMVRWALQHGQAKMAAMLLTEFTELTAHEHKSKLSSWKLLRYRKGLNATSIRFLLANTPDFPRDGADWVIVIDLLGARDDPLEETEATLKILLDRGVRKPPSGSYYLSRTPVFATLVDKMKYTWEVEKQLPALKRILQMLMLAGVDFNDPNENVISVCTFRRLPLLECVLEVTNCDIKTCRNHSGQAPVNVAIRDEK